MSFLATHRRVPNRRPPFDVFQQVKIHWFFGIILLTTFSLFQAGRQTGTNLEDVDVKTSNEQEQGKR